ncbi:unnamed protein product, partial [Urochloa humidicola]
IRKCQVAASGGDALLAWSRMLAVRVEAFGAAPRPPLPAAIVPRFGQQNHSVPDHLHLSADHCFSAA